MGITKGVNSGQVERRLGSKEVRLTLQRKRRELDFLLLIDGRPRALFQCFAVPDHVFA